MNVAIARKELKEMLPLIVLAALAQFWFLFGGMGFLPKWLGDLGPGNMIPFFDPLRDGDLVLALVMVGGCLAIALGLGQTMWELFRGTFPFLLHRPPARSRIFGTKLLVGAGAWVALTVLPIVIYALWAATPGAHASPFEWWMVASSVPLCLAVLLVYLASFLCGLRPARWYVSRFLPGALAGFLVLVVQLLPLILPFGATLASAILLTACIGYVLVILQVAQTRDYS